MLVSQVCVLVTICCSWSGLFEEAEHRIYFGVCLTPLRADKCSWSGLFEELERRIFFCPCLTPRAENLRILLCVLFPDSCFFYIYIMCTSCLVILCSRMTYSALHCLLCLLPTRYVIKHKKEDTDKRHKEGQAGKKEGR